jgi:signal transduction histidine kinase
MPVFSSAMPSKEKSPRRDGAIPLRQLPNTPHVGEGARANRLFAKSVFLGLILLCAVGLIGSVIAYRARFFVRLLCCLLLQVVTLLLISLHFRRRYRVFLLIRTRAAEQEQLTALASAASLIAREVKNSLNGLKAAASVLASGTDPSLPVRAMLGQIDRLGHLASSLLFFAKPLEPQSVEVALDPLIRQAVEALTVLPEAEEVKVETSLNALSNVACDPLLLVTAIDNLIRNAIEAAVTRKDLGRLERPTVWIRSRVSGGDALIEVEDNAGGLPVGFEHHLFEPFVSFKSKGIGLGLSTARRAVEQQGGTLSLQRTDQGARFIVQLPRSK